MSQVQLCLHHGTGTIARAIQFQTRSRWNHVSIHHNGVLWEAREWQGVVNTRTLEEARRSDEVAVFRIDGLTPEGERAMLKFMARQLGKPYDYVMVLGFITRSKGDRRQLGQWFCSEYGFASSAKGGVKLLERVDPYEVSPRDIALSPRLVAA